ncbi:hypothetical protein QT970_06700 [Microcoleus sp. herbarium8]|uniref:hypothetical protein n=1 Tax=Microcoleus sp. herbarium8 TaxID=3055436 RepID=UPI002FD28DF5
MKYLSLFILVLILCAVMALGSVLPGVTAYKEGAIDRVADLNRGNTVSASRYSVNGDRNGIVTVKEATTGKIIRTFQMDSGVVVRETFLLEGGKTVAASQKDHTMFWDLETGKEVRRFPHRIYGFSPDETKFFTYESPFAQVFLYTYPNGERICKLVEHIQGPAGFQFSPYRGFQFSPNNQFLVIVFYPGLPSDDENYPNPNPVTRGYTIIKLFNLRVCHDVEEFSELRIFRLGEFTKDSKSYYMKDIRINTNSGRKEGSWLFNLETYEIKEIDISK